MKHNQAMALVNKPLEDIHKKDNLGEKELARLKRKKAKHDMLRAKYIKRSTAFLEFYEKLEYNLRSEAFSHRMDEVISISYIFGTSLILPKEIYRIQLPTGKLIYEFPCS